MLVIFADDLTGTLDTAAPFASRGLHCEVALTVDAISEAIGPNPDVLAINVGSRECDAETAKQLTLAALAAIPDGSIRFKKVDSRLKGNIIAELDATPFRIALVAPAIPDFGRVVVGGAVQGFGVDSPIVVADKLGRHAQRATIPDTASQEEMVYWLEASQRAGADLLVGARGLAEALACQMKGKEPPQFAEIPSGPALFVIGSRDPITLTQIDLLQAAFEPRYFPAPNGHLAAAPYDGSPITLVQAVPGDEAVSSEDVSQALADSVCPSLTDAATTLLLSGGATAEAVLKKMGIERFRLLGECLPGLGLAHAQGHCIIAKSGGFGGSDTLREIADRTLRKTG